MNGQVNNKTGMVEDQVSNMEKRGKKSLQYSNKRQKVDNMKIKRQRNEIKEIKHLTSKSSKDNVENGRG